MNPLETRLRGNAECPRCAGLMPSPEIVEGERKDVICPYCQWVGEVTLEHQMMQLFEWNFDIGSHTVIWDVNGLRDFLLTLPDAPVVDIPWKLAARWLRDNAFGQDLEADKASASGDMPIIIIEHPTCIPECKEEYPLLPIDGWHRMLVAVKEQRDLKAWCCTAELEKRYRVLDIIHLGGTGHEKVPLQTQMERWDAVAPFLIDPKA